MGLPALALAQIYMGALKSAGRTRTPMLVALGGIWCIRVPLSSAGTIAESTIVWLAMAIDLLARFRSAGGFSAVRGYLKHFSSHIVINIPFG